MDALKRILLVEDSDLDAELTLDGLRSHHLANEVLRLRNGSEALDYLHARGAFAGRAPGNPAVILLDLNMPHVDGLEVLRQVRGTPELSTIPVVLMTSSKEAQDIEIAYRRGANAYVVKPIEFSEFIKAIEQVGGLWAIVNESASGTSPAGVAAPSTDLPEPSHRFRMRNRGQLFLPERPAPLKPIRDLHFLVAEDQAVQRNVLVEILRQLGARYILQASDGAAAWAIIQAQPQSIDFVITDLAMPGMDGMEFIRRLGEARVSASIIIMSGWDRSLIAAVESMAAAYGISILGALPKPATPKKLAALIEARSQEPSIKPWSGGNGQTFTLDEITEGLKQDQFEPFFQPKIELATLKVKGAEALARWRHPHYGIVPPSAFIPALEQSGAIDSLTWVILEKAAACCHDWQRSEADAFVQVNLSIKSLDDLQLAHRVTDIVRRQNLDPHSVVLEVTESAATIEMGRALENLVRVRMNGFGLSIDDYGTGYASMQQLARIAFTQLKVDRFFVKNAESQESSKIILESSCHLAKKLGLESVAEGVETESEWALVLGLGFDLAQGYFIAPPLPADVYTEWLRDWMHLH